VDVLAVDALDVWIVIGDHTQLYARLASRSPVLAGAFPMSAMERQVADIKLLLLGL
jgi:hypothetical protein